MARPDLVQMPGTLTYMLTRDGSTTGFPVSPATFRYVVISLWVCLGQDVVFRSIGWSCTLNFFSLLVRNSDIELTLSAGVSNSWFSGSYAHVLTGPITNVQVSVDGEAGIVQVYANDVALTLTSGGLGPHPPGPFQLTAFYSDWGLNSNTGPVVGPGIGDLYMAAPATFFDLSVTANRRKFQNADLSPVDLGTDAVSVLGTAPPIYLTARGGNASNFAVNNGVGGPFGVNPGYTPTMLAADTCTVPWPVASPKLAMDNVVATASQALLSTNLISLRWSDDRGHSYGSPVSQSIGEAGEYRTSLQWQRLSYARDRVFELSWSVPFHTALLGAFVDVTPAQS